MGMLLENVRSRKGQRMQLIIRRRCYSKQEEAVIQMNVEQADWKDDTDDESDDQELEAHYMYMAKLQQVSPDVVVFAIDCQHLEQSESVHNTYLLEQDAQNVSIVSVDMNYDSEQID
uniref:Gag-Pol polyprotein n=1 Tax=Tanacetum cinerariifolium TaxID=118510 RepID=A0A699SCC8_TANCI|nr:hypothetical protein [Tanacetum cinerariifolium]